MTANRSIDTLIVGGGPAGCACGISLKQNGRDCLIVDKASFPRTKLCAGLLTAKSRDCLDRLLGPAEAGIALSNAHVSRQGLFTIWRGNSQMVSCDLNSEAASIGLPQGVDYSIHMVNRPELDMYLLNNFRNLGGDVILGDGIKSIDFASKVATLESGASVKYNRIVAADGANSRVLELVRKQSGSFPKNGEKTLCLEINVSKEDIDVKGVNIYFGVVPDSYAYVFEKENNVCIGLLKLKGKNFDVNSRFSDFCNQIGLRNIDRYPVKGAMIPHNTGIKNPVWNNQVFFVGDAAGLIEYPTCEGIFYALQTGMYAAESIVKESSGWYSKNYRKLFKYVRRSEFYQWIISNRFTMDFIYRNAAQHSHFCYYFYLMRIERFCTHSFVRIVWRWKI